MYKYILIFILLVLPIFTGCKSYTQKDIDRLNVTISSLQDENSALQARISELEKKLQRQNELRVFESPDELKEFLYNDETDRRPYIHNDFDCEDFAMALMRNAVAKGYFMGLYFYDTGTIGHIANATIVGDIVYIVEPQYDTIYKHMPLDVKGGK